MSRLQQYLIFGGLIALLQTDFIKGILQSSSFLGLAMGGIIILLAVAGGVTVYAKKKKKRHDDDHSTRM